MNEKKFRHQPADLCDICDISANLGPLWPVTAEVIEMAQYVIYLLAYILASYLQVIAKKTCKFQELTPTHQQVTCDSLTLLMSIDE